MSALRMSLHESMQRLVIGTPLLARESKNEVVKAYIVYPVLDHIRKTIIPGAGTIKIPSTLITKVWESSYKPNRELKTRTGS